MGLANYFVSHIKNRRLTMAPLLKLLRKGVGFEWTTECETAMRMINNLLVSDKVMGFCDFNKPLFLYTDDLEDPVNGLHTVIGYWGRALSTAEQKWPITQLELLAAAR